MTEKNKKQESKKTPEDLEKSETKKDKEKTLEENGVFFQEKEFMDLHEALVAMGIDEKLVKEKIPPGLLMSKLRSYHSKKHFVVDFDSMVYPVGFQSFEEECGALVNNVLTTSEHPLYKSFVAREQQKRNIKALKDSV